MKSKFDVFKKVHDKDACVVINKDVPVKDYPDQTRFLCLFCERKLEDLKEGHLTGKIKGKIFMLCEDCAFYITKLLFGDSRWR